MLNLLGVKDTRIVSPLRRNASKSSSALSLEKRLLANGSIESDAVCFVEMDRTLGVRRWVLVVGVDEDDDEPRGVPFRYVSVDGREPEVTFDLRGSPCVDASDVLELCGEPIDVPDGPPAWELACGIAHPLAVRWGRRRLVSAWISVSSLFRTAG